MKKKLNLHRFSDIFFPPKCLNCKEIIDKTDENKVLCKACFQKFLTELEVSCPICEREYSLCICKPKTFVPDGFAYSLPYEEEEGISKRLLLSCKNKYNKALLQMLSEHMLCTAKKRNFPLESCILTYVPRAPEKFAMGGYDQAEELSRAFSKLTSLKRYRLLSHRPLTKEQKKLKASKRKGNAEKSYTLTHLKKKIYRKDILLIDDILTTGATVNACTSLLKSAGAERVFCLTAAKNTRRALFEAYNTEEKHNGEEDRN